MNPCHAVSLEGLGVVVFAHSGRLLQSMGKAGDPRILAAFKATPHSTASTSYLLLHPVEFAFLQSRGEIILHEDISLASPEVVGPSNLVVSSGFSARDRALFEAYTELRKKGFHIRFVDGSNKVLRVSGSGGKETMCRVVLAGDNAVESVMNEENEQKVLGIQKGVPCLRVVVDGDVAVFMTEVE